MNASGNKYWILAPIVVAFTLGLSGCGRKTLDFRNAEIVNGKVYEANANTPYSGKVTNFPESKVLGSQKDAAMALSVQLTKMFRKADRYFGMIGTGPFPCDIQVSDGLPDGEVTCREVNSTALLYQTTLRQGVLHGAFKAYEQLPSNNLILQVNFNDGKLDGDQEMFSMTTHKLLSRLRWRNGVLHGPGERFDENTGAVVETTAYKDGKVDGDIVMYAPDGKQIIYKVKAVSGLKDGPEEQFDANTGKPLMYAQWFMGIKNGAFKQWDANGKLIVDAVFENDVQVKTAGTAVSAAVTSSTSTSNCADQWMAAFRKENGPDAMVTQDQMGEWDAWCREGKTPKQ